MSDKKQTAVEWLFEQLPEHLRLSRDGFDMLQQAKQMEREQVTQFADEYADNVMAGMLKTASEYYEQTYGK